MFVWPLTISARRAAEQSVVAHMMPALCIPSHVCNYASADLCDVLRTMWTCVGVDPVLHLGIVGFVFGWASFVSLRCTNGHEESAATWKLSVQYIYECHLLKCKRQDRGLTDKKSLALQDEPGSCFHLINLPGNQTAVIF